MRSCGRLHLRAIVPPNAKARMLVTLSGTIEM
jgi:hypothetical protein